jgi:hypothetical protein
MSICDIDIINLGIILRTEVNSPEILPFPTELVEGVIEAIKNQKVIVRYTNKINL